MLEWLFQPSMSYSRVGYFFQELYLFNGGIMADLPDCF